MGGSSIREAKKALEIFLKGLEKEVRFNLYRFGSTSESLFKESVLYEPHNLKKAMGYLRNIEADMGGTELLPPLREIYQEEIPPGHEKKIILITDGQVRNEQEIMELVKGNNRIRVFSVGIGYGPNEYFIRQLSRCGGGTCQLIAPGERIEPKILSLFKKVMGGRTEDVRIRIDRECEQAPASPVAFHGEVLTLLARMKGSLKYLETVTITGKAGNEYKEWNVPIIEMDGEAIPTPQLWARELIRELEEGNTAFSEAGSRQSYRKEKLIKDKIINVSRQFGIISRQTSFVAVEKRPEKDKVLGELVLRKIPILLTRDWGGIEPNFRGFFKSDIMAMPRRIEISDRFYKTPTLIYSSMVKSKVRAEPSAYDILLRILAIQRAEGGFEIDRDLAMLIGTSVTDLRKTSERMEVNMKTDKFLLLCTALVLSIPKKHFATATGDWSGVVEKSEKWLMRELLRTEATIDGKSLENWVYCFTENLKISAIVK